MNQMIVSPGIANIDEDLPIINSDRFEIRGVLGKGGLGVVYRVFDNLLKREVALKVFNPIDLVKQQMEAEGQTRNEAMLAEVYPGEAARLVNREPVLDNEGNVMLKMDIYEGGKLSDRDYTSMSLEERLQIISDVAEGFREMHTVINYGKGWINGDFKPENVLLDRFGRAYISDFNRSSETEMGGRTITADRTDETSMYRAPEHREHGNLSSKRGDIWSFGNLVYSLFTDRNVYEDVEYSGNRNEFRRGIDLVLEEKVESGEIPEQLEGVLVKTLDPRKNRRYSDGAELREEVFDSLAPKKKSLSEIISNLPNSVKKAACVALTVGTLLAGGNALREDPTYNLPTGDEAKYGAFLESFLIRGDEESEPYRVISYDDELLQGAGYGIAFGTSLPLREDFSEFLELIPEVSNNMLVRNIMKLYYINANSYEVTGSARISYFPRGFLGERYKRCMESLEGEFDGHFKRESICKLSGYGTREEKLQKLRFLEEAIVEGLRNSVKASETGKVGYFGNLEVARSRTVNIGIALTMAMYGVEPVKEAMRQSKRDALDELGKVKDPQGKRIIYNTTEIEHWAKLVMRNNNEVIAKINKRGHGINYVH